MYTNKEKDRFNMYLEEVFKPAQTWAHSSEGKAWIEKYIPPFISLEAGKMK